MAPRKTKPRRYLGRTLFTPLTSRQHRQYALGWPPGFDRLRKILWFQVGAILLSAYVTMVATTAFHESTHWRKHMLVLMGVIGMVILAGAVLVLFFGCAAAIKSSFTGFRRYTVAVWFSSAIFVTFHSNQLWAIISQYADQDVDQCKRNKCHFSVYMAIPLIFVSVAYWIALPLWCSMLGRALEREVLAEAKHLRTCPLEVRNSPAILEDAIFNEDDKL